MTDQSWVALQLADLLHSVEERLGSAVSVVSVVDADGDFSDVVLRAHDVVRVKEAATEFVEHASWILALAEQLPDGDLEVSHSDLVEAAALDLATGIIDPARVLLAMGVMPMGTAWRALALALRTTDFQTAWGDLTLGRVLNAPFDGQPQLAERVLAITDLRDDDAFSSCDETSLERLATALEAHAPRD